MDEPTTTLKPLSLGRTIEALLAYDAYLATNPYGIGVDGVCDTNEQVYAVKAEEDRLAQAVGEAFGLDTADRNNLDTCRSCVRPGPWLRGLVSAYMSALTPDEEAAVRAQIEVLRKAGGRIHGVGAPNPPVKVGFTDWDPDFAARQVVDDCFRAGLDIRFKQHLVEALIAEMCSAAEGGE